jgi:hypothetical protein
VGAADGEHILDTEFGPGVSLRLLARPVRARCRCPSSPAPVADSGRYSGWRAREEPPARQEGAAGGRG